MIKFMIINLKLNNSTKYLYFLKIDQYGPGHIYDDFWTRRDLTELVDIIIAQWDWLKGKEFWISKIPIHYEITENTDREYLDTLPNKLWEVLARNYTIPDEPEYQKPEYPNNDENSEVMKKYKIEYDEWQEELNLLPHILTEEGFDELRENAKKYPVYDFEWENIYICYYCSRGNVYQGEEFKDISCLCGNNFHEI